MISAQGQRMDIEGRADLLRIMERFYELMLADEELLPIFTEVAPVHLEEHLPLLADFWEGILFGAGNYRNNPIAIHLNINRRYPLTQRHFELWLHYFNQAVDELHTGEVAHLMQTRALSIATVMQIKMAQADAAG